MGTDVEVIQPTWMNHQLMYQVKAAQKHSCAAPLKRWVSANVLEPSANAEEWDYGWWNAKTEDFLSEEEKMTENSPAN
jgi:hypothetical protein